MEKTYDDDEIEIDLLELLGEFRRKIWIILGTIILFGGAAGAFSAFVLTLSITHCNGLYSFKRNHIDIIGRFADRKPADKGL